MSYRKRVGYLQVSVVIMAEKRRCLEVVTDASISPTLMCALMTLGDLTLAQQGGGAAPQVMLRLPAQGRTGSHKIQL